MFNKSTGESSNQADFQERENDNTISEYLEARLLPSFSGFSSNQFEQNNPNLSSILTVDSDEMYELSSSSNDSSASFSVHDSSDENLSELYHNDH